jgi:hypothetical protein
MRPSKKSPAGDAEPREGAAPTSRPPCRASRDASVPPQSTIHAQIGPEKVGLLFVRPRRVSAADDLEAVVAPHAGGVATTRRGNKASHFRCANTRFGVYNKTLDSKGCHPRLGESGLGE